MQVCVFVSFISHIQKGTKAPRYELNSGLKEINTANTSYCTNIILQPNATDTAIATARIDV